MLRKPLRMHPELENLKTLISIVDDLVRRSGLTKEKLVGCQIARGPIDNNPSGSS
jgi:hypothetical protein